MTGRVAVIVGSTRPKRICPEVAGWVLATAQRATSLTFEPVDLREVALPFLDEPEPAARGVYEHEHTRRWSALVSSFDGFILVFPQYNWGYPAVLKNALDYLYAEWRGKPVGLVTYGNHGGERAAAQMEIVLLRGLHMRVTATKPALQTNLAQLDAAGRFIDVDAAFAPFVDGVNAMAAELAAFVAEPIAIAHQ